MSILSVAARRAAPMAARSGRQVRQVHTPHFDTFAVDTSNKRQAFIYYGAIIGALATPVVAIRYQLKQAREEKRRF